MRPMTRVGRAVEKGETKGFHEDLGGCRDRGDTRSLDSGRRRG
jgi:hypothetical protein